MPYFKNMILLILFDVSEYSYGDYYSMLSDVFVVDTVPSEQVTEIWYC